MAANGISTLPTKEARQIAKLDLAAEKRGKSYDIDLLPTKYVGNTLVNNPNVGGLVAGRPWTDAPPAPTENDFGFTGDTNNWIINGGMNAGSTFSSPAPSNPAYTYPDGSYTGKTYNFDGTTWMSSMNLAINGAWRTNAITIDFWFYPTANNVQLMSESNHPDVTSGYHYSMLEIDGDGYVHARFYNGQYPTSPIVSSNTVELNAWNHIWLTEDTQGGHSFELNGTGTGLQNPVYTRVAPGTAEYFVIGTSDSTNLGSSGRFQGNIGYLNIYDYVHASSWPGTNARFRPAPTYTLTSDAGVDEGGGLTFTASGTDVPDGEYYWTIETHSEDFTTTSGSLGVSNNYGSFIVVPNADATTEGSETFTVALRSGSVSGPILVTSAAITINDTSTTPVATGLSVNWYGTTSEITPTGSYTNPSTGVVSLPQGSYVNVGQNLQSTTFTVTVDANLNTAGSPWVVLWGNDNYGAGTGYVLHWNTTTNAQLGIWTSRFVSATTPNITTAGRRVYTSVVDGLNVAFYIDGTLINSGTLTGSATTIPNNNFLIGARHSNGGTLSPPSNLDDKGGIYYSAKVEGTALTATEVQAAWFAMPGTKTYTVRQHLYNYTGGGGNSSLFVLDSDYPNVTLIPLGATATVNGQSISVTGISVPGSLVYFNGNPGHTISWNGSTGNITTGTYITFTWTV